MNEEQLKKELFEALRKDDAEEFKILVNKAQKGNSIYLIGHWNILNIYTWHRIN